MIFQVLSPISAHDSGGLGLGQVKIVGLVFEKKDMM